MTKVAAVILADGVADAERQARMALAAGADLVELRLDRIRDVGVGDVRRLASAVGPRSILTVRSASQGGPGQLTESRRSDLLKEACTRPFPYVDIELERDGPRAAELTRLARRHRATLIVSHHFSRPAGLGQVREALDACAAIGPVAKVVVPVETIDSAIELGDLARTEVERGRRLVLIGMGVAGMLIRAGAGSAGQEIQYASAGRPAAPGQLSLATAKRLRGRDSWVLGLVGHPVGHSLSPAIHEAGLEALGLPGTYLPFDVDAAGLESLLAASDRFRIRGFNVTIPYKESIVEALDELDGDAEGIGAVNTVVVGDGWTKGHNTDVFGFRLSLRSLGLRVGERRVLVIGAGGAAKAVVHVLLREGASVAVANRTAARAEALADAFDEPIEILRVERLDRSGPWDLVVNATPLGTKGFAADLPVPEAVIAKAGFVYDLGYNPPDTALIAAAKRLGRPHASGLEMLLHQAAKSFELWTGRSPPVDAMRRAAKEALA